MDKEKKLLNIYCAVFKLEINKGHLKWSISDLSREANITRSLIYLYFDGHKLKIIEEAINILGRVLVGIEDSQLKFWRENNISSAINSSTTLIKEVPEIIQFYFKYRNKEPFKNQIQYLEQKGINKRKNLLKVSPSEAKVLFFLQMGLGLGPNFSKKEMEFGLKILGLDKITL